MSPFTPAKIVLFATVQRQPCLAGFGTCEQQHVPPQVWLIRAMCEAIFRAKVSTIVAVGPPSVRISLIAVVNTHCILFSF